MEISHIPYTPTPIQVNFALLSLRVASATAFLYHGSAILFGWFGGPGPARFAALHSWPVFLAVLVGLAQIAGGLAIINGILLRIGAACVSVVMLGAILLVHIRNGFDVSNGGIEYALTQLLIAGALLLMGPGRYSATFFLARSVRRLGFREDTDGNNVDPRQK